MWTIFPASLALGRDHPFLFYALLIPLAAFLGSPEWWQCHPWSVTSSVALFMFDSVFIFSIITVWSSTVPQPLLANSFFWVSSFVKCYISRDMETKQYFCCLCVHWITHVLRSVTDVVWKKWCICHSLCCSSVIYVVICGLKT